MNTKIQDFFRAYNVRLPNRRIRQHRPEYVRSAIENIDFLLKNTNDAEIVEALNSARQNWISAAGFVPAVATENAKAKQNALSLHSFIRENDLVKPDAFRVSTPEEARSYRQRIVDAIQANDRLSKEQITTLNRWVKGWKDIERRYSVDTSDPNTRKGPPASYLARKRNKSAESQQVRQRLRGRK